MTAIAAIGIEEFLGGAAVTGQKIESEMDLYELSAAGLPKCALTSLSAKLGLSLRAMAQLLRLGERTIQRKKEQDLLDTDASEQVLQIAVVYATGAALFGSVEIFQRWMATENIAFGGKKPLDLLPSRYGARLILDVLGRIDSGVYS